MSYITLEEIEKATKPFIKKLKTYIKNYLFIVEVDWGDNYKLMFSENGLVKCDSGFIPKELDDLLEKLIQEELIVNWNDETNEGYFVNKNANIESLAVIAAKLNALYQETLKLRKELEEKIESVKDDLRDHERDYNHERTNNYW